MNNITNMEFSLSDDENLKFNGMTPYQYTDREVKIKSISANSTPLEPDADKNVDIPVVSGYNPGIIRVMGSGWGVKIATMNVGDTEYKGCLTTEPATPDDINKRQNSHKPITPATLQYAVEVCTNQDSEAELTETQLKLPPSTQYLKNVVGDIETALDNINAIQNSLIGGDSV